MPPPDVNLNLGNPNTLFPGLLPFLKHARRHFLPTIRNGTATTPTPIYVMGNQSADLDSMISAIVYSYFFSRADKDKRSYIPLVNLPDVPSGPELRRLRPEFACALELSVSSSLSTSPPTSEVKRGKKKTDGDGIVQLLKDHILTVADLRDGLSSGSGTAHKDSNQSSRLGLDCILVDWNNIPHKVLDGENEMRGKGSIDGLSDLVTFSVTGCIDHHVDEGFVPPVDDIIEGNPRVIELGSGSCTSLVIREVQQRGLWPSSRPVDGKGLKGKSDDDGNIQVAKLALAAILIDTNNMIAEGKVTEVDREAVSFLTNIISSSSSAGAGKRWNRDSFFDQISYAKAHCLDWLDVKEIFCRDYKDWTEPTSSGEKRVIGIASVIRPLKWMIDKANDEENNNSGTQHHDLKPLLKKLKKFSTEKHLNLVSIMTAFTSEDEGQEGEFARELLVWGLNEDSNEHIQRFIHVANDQLDLQKWNDFPVEGSQEYTGNLFVWKQGNLAKSRKQVAPILRESISS